MSNFEPLVAFPSSADRRGCGTSLYRRQRAGRSRWNATVSAGSPIETAEPPIFMGLLDGVPAWGSGTNESTDVPDGYEWHPLRNLGARLDTPSWMLAGRAVQTRRMGQNQSLLRALRYCH